MFGPGFGGQASGLLALNPSPVHSLIGPKNTAQARAKAGWAQADPAHEGL